MSVDTVLQQALALLTHVEHWITQDQHSLILMAALFIAWAVVFTGRRARERHDHRRPAPLSVDDLGRAIHRAACDGDLGAYRDLFLDRHEAHKLLGGNTRQYMSARKSRTIRHALSALTAQIPADAAFVGMKDLGQERWALKLALPGQKVSTVDAGILTQVGNVWRVFGPPRKPGHQRTAQARQHR